MIEPDEAKRLLATLERGMIAPNRDLYMHTGMR